MGALAEDEPVLAAGAAGAGNMNLVLRVRTPQRSLIVKQSLPWVAKYPDISAPEDRILVEHAFYRFTAPIPEVSGAMPELLGFDRGARILLLEDCGDRPDFSAIYRRSAELDASVLRQLAEWLAALHGQPLGSAERETFANASMLALNHLHLFEYPLDPENGLDLDSICPGLKALAASLQGDAAFVEAVASLGQEVYLAPGPVLVHGDFFPGSLLDTPDGPKVIDPEFCHCGVREFDIAVFCAHLHIAGLSDTVIRAFCDHSAELLAFDRCLGAKLTGVEIMRRMIGVAQLPGQFALEGRRRLLQMARAFVLDEGSAL
jgi:5-methylthioribose kinase